MSKATLLGIATQPKHDDNDRWTGADIMASIEVEAPDLQPGVTALHRIGLNITLTPTMLRVIKAYGYHDEAEDFIMKRVRTCMDAMAKKFEGTEHDADIIYDVIRLKMPRFVSKSVERVYYSDNLQTGEIFESNLRI